MKNQYTLTQPVANTYLVRERDRRRWRELVYVLLIVLPLGLAVLGSVWMRIETLATGYAIDELERNLEGLLRQERQLRLKAGQLTSPAVLERRAAEELGMVSPRAEQMVFLESAP